MVKLRRNRFFKQQIVPQFKAGHRLLVMIAVHRGDDQNIGDFPFLKHFLIIGVIIFFSHAEQLHDKRLLNGINLANRRQFHLLRMAFNNVRVGEPARAETQNR